MMRTRQERDEHNMDDRVKREREEGTPLRPYQEEVLAEIRRTVADGIMAVAVAPRAGVAPTASTSPGLHMQTLGRARRPFEYLRREMFNSYDASYGKSEGKIIAGIKHEIQTDLGLETHECYQYDSLESVVAEAVAFRDTIPGMKRIRVVTHLGGYQSMKTLCEWRAE